MPFVPPLTCEEVETAFGGLFEGVSSLPCGGQGAVFKCTHQASQEVVALKIYFANQVQQRTQREVNLMKRIEGDTLVSLVGSGEILIREAKCVFIATKFIQGDVLSEVVGRERIDIQVAARCGYDISKAIQLLWAERIVHRDINPKNIMITDEGASVLIDLGIARHIDLATLTLPGCTWGTQGYLSPEQARAVKQLSYKSDIFALGITLQESLAGSHPVNNRQDLLVNGCPIKTSAIRADIPRSLAEIIDGMLQVRAYERPRLDEIYCVLGTYI